jgi:O-acetyl-ADP-ribose deacetylase (regulator of RNase III)
MIEARVGDSTIELVQGDITLQEVDGIVNAANSRLAGGGGVDGAIHRAGGPEIMAECRRIGGCPAGQAVATTAGRLAAKAVIHAVGPVYKNGRSGEAALLASAYEASFRLASEMGLRSLALPSLSTGAYGYPMEDAARIALSSAIEYLGRHPEIERIRFVLFGEDAFETHKLVLSELAPTQRIKTI